jgi:methyl-accepting chemotaxis protein
MLSGGGPKMKHIQSLKFRFVFFFALFIIVLCTVITSFNIFKTIETISRIFAEKGIPIVEEAATLIDGDAFEQLVKTGSDEDPYYEKVRLELLALKNNYPTVKFLYTMAPVSGSTFMFVIDGSAEPGGEDFSAFGDEEDASDYDEAFMQSWETGKTMTSGMEYQEGWGWLVSIYTPIKNSSGTVVGIIGCDFDAAELYDDLTQNITQQIILSLGFVALGIIVMLLFLRMIFTPLKTIDGILKEISSGEGDLSRRIEYHRKNEIGELAKHFNLTLDKIKSLVIVIKEKSVFLHTVGNELTASMAETASAVNEITANIQRIKGKVLNQSASVVETTATMNQVTDQIDKLNSHVEDQSESVSRSSSAIEEMLANIQSVIQTLIRNSENAKELAAASDEGRSSLDGVSEDINEIARESAGILEINAVMQNISSQTNLLSMNAAIEAAHAGETGKGFAVVAGEIRKLAESSGNQSKTIAQVLKNIKNSIDKITGSTNEVLKKFQAITEKVQIVSEQEEQIRNSMEEQGQGSQQILGAIGKLNELTQMVKAGSSKMLEGSKEVIHESRNLETATQEITNGMDEMVYGTDQIIAAVNRVNDISRNNQESIDALVAEVSKFKVE